MQQSASISPELRDAYRAFDDELRLQRSRIIHFLTVIFMPMGASVDWLMYPDHKLPLAMIRIMSTLAAGVLFALHYCDFGKRHIRTVGMLWFLMLDVTFCWMIYITNGPMSPYYATLNLVMLFAAVLLPWTLFEATFASVSTLVLYIITCFCHPPVWDSVMADSITRATTFGNCYFIFLTGVLCGVSSKTGARARLDDFVLRQELDIQNVKLQNADRLKTEFFANVSHELRTPLTLILTPIEDLLRQQDKLPSLVHEALIIAHKNGLRLLKLINEMLEVMRLENRDATLQQRAVDLSTFVPGVVDSIRHLGTASELTIATDVEPGDYVIRGDPDRLEKVILNLLTNAIKFTPAHGTITVRLRRDGDDAIVDVEDTGIGIAADELHHVFDRFHQADGSATRQYQGVGIGLSLARDLVERHNGTLTAVSKEGEGTIFTVRIPIAAELDVDGDVADTAIVDRPIDAGDDEPFRAAFKSADRVLVSDRTSSEELPTVGSGSHTILVVDDEPDMRRFIVSILAQQYRVLQAADGESGLALARREKPALAVLDWMLPGMDGLTVCHELRNDAETRDMKVLLLTARVDDASKIDALATGADDFLTKPFSTPEVTTRINNLLQTRDLQCSLQERNDELQVALRKLQEAESQLVQNEKMAALGTLSAGLLHEVNNPLNFSMVALQFAEQEAADDEELRDVLNDIKEGMERIKVIITDLRTFAYPEELSTGASFQTAEIVDAALRMVGHEMANVDVVNNVTNCSVNGSSTQITHVLMNLLVNSTRAVADSENPTITISGTLRDDDGRFELSVEDNGTGIKPEIIDKIFEPFFTTQDVGEGMGLGLSICHTVIENHGGKIWAESEVGRGAKISFDLQKA